MEQTHPNLTLIQEFFTAYGNDDLAAIKKVLVEDIKWHIPGEHPLSGTKKGIGEVMDFFKSLHKAAFKASSIVMGVNDGYVIDCHRNWSTMEGEENLNSMSCLLWKIENNKIVEVFNFPENQKDVNTFFNKIYG
ncbi:MAG: nuclear transport factor 2 family protein [Cellulophaga sp.]